VRRFQLHLVEGGASICNRNRIMTGVRFLFSATLRRHDLAAEIWHIKEPQKLPPVLSPEEVKRVLTSLKACAMLTLPYGCGLRASEVVRLWACDIDSEQMIIRIVQSKGRRDRHVMLSFRRPDRRRHRQGAPSLSGALAYGSPSNGSTRVEPGEPAWRIPTCVRLYMRSRMAAFHRRGRARRVSAHQRNAVPTGRPSSSTKPPASKATNSRQRLPLVEPIERAHLGEDHAAPIGGRDSNPAMTTTKPPTKVRRKRR
jgi:integrase